MRKQAGTATPTPTEASFPLDVRMKEKILEVATSELYQIPLTLRNHLYIFQQVRALLCTLYLNPFTNRDTILLCLMVLFHTEFELFYQQSNAVPVKKHSTIPSTLFICSCLCTVSPSLADIPEDSLPQKFPFLKT